jgi:hypothetical protein
MTLLTWVHCFLKYSSGSLYTNSEASVRERTIPTERPPLVDEVSATFADRGCHMVSVTDLTTAFSAF